MRRCGYLLSMLVAGMLLSACAETSPSGLGHQAQAPVTAMQAGLPDAFAGAWFVTAAYSRATQHRIRSDRHVGTAVLLKDAQIGDIDGGHCGSPTLAHSQVSAAAAGLTWPVTDNIARLQVTCAGKPFATYLQVPEAALPKAMQPKAGAASDGAAHVLIAQRSETIYILERAEQILARQGNSTTVLTAKANLAAQPATPKKTLAASVKPIQTSKAMQPSNAATSTKKSAPVKTAMKPAMTKSVGEKSAVTADKTMSMKSMSPLAPAKSSTTAITAKNVAAKQNRQAGDKTASAAMQDKKPVEALLMAKPTNKSPTPGNAIHLASYTDMPSATRGWEKLHAQYAGLAALTPIYVSTSIAGKGDVIRLFATGASSAKLQQVCADLHAQHAYCSLHP